jgi:hypothetical protein
MAVVLQMQVMTVMVARAGLAGQMVTALAAAMAATVRAAG